MAHRIAAYVHVAGFRLEPGDVPPPAIADQVTNPKAWTTEAPTEPERPLREEAPAVEVTDKGTPEKEDVAQEDDGDQAQDPVVEGEDPPRPGKSAKVEVWRAYILDVADVTEGELADLTKDQLIEMANQLDAEGDE